MIKGYQLCISPLIGTHCRFYPTCSTYALQAIKLHGLIKGSFYSLKRISRCHPWHQGGIDPIPEKINDDCKHD